jgi:acetyl esterase/lipase
MMTVGAVVADKRSSWDIASHLWVAPGQKRRRPTRHATVCLAAIATVTVLCTLPAMASAPAPVIVNYGPQLATIYSLRQPSPEPVVIILHGGGWVSGTRGDMRPFAIAWQSHGVVVVAPDFTPGAYPAGINDLRVLMASLQLNASTYGGDPSHILIAGTSSGGNLAGLLWDQPGVHAIASWSGPLNLPLFATDPSPDGGFRAHLAIYEGPGGINTIPASPVTYAAFITPHPYPPMLMFNASAEKIPQSQATSMGAALTAANVTNQVIILTTTLHAVAYASMIVPGTSQTVSAYTLTWMLSQP